MKLVEVDPPNGRRAGVDRRPSPRRLAMRVATRTDGSPGAKSLTLYMIPSIHATVHAVVADPELHSGLHAWMSRISCILADRLAHRVSIHAQMFNDSLLTSAGLKRISVRPTRDPKVVIEAVPI